MAVQKVTTVRVRYESSSDRLTVGELFEIVGMMQESNIPPNTGIILSGTRTLSLELDK